MNIRRANLDDFDWIFNECLEFSKVYASKISLTEDKEHAQKVLQNFIVNHLVLLAEKEDGSKAGFIAGLVQPHHYNPNILMLTELLWWVRPEERGTKAGAALLDAFVEFGKKHCKWVTFTIEETTPISDEPLIKRGFKLTEKAYLMECH